MKKLIVAFAAIAMTVCAQAAAVTWSSGAFLDYTGELVRTSAGGYTATVAFYTFDGTDYIDVSSTFGGTLTTTTVGKGPTMKSDTGDGMATGTYYAQLTIVSGDWTLTSEMAVFSYNSSDLGTKILTFATGAGFATETTKFDQTSANYGWQSVPEPTSGLLLLIGMGALALRRKLK